MCQDLLSHPSKRYYPSAIIPPLLDIPELFNPDANSSMWMAASLNNKDEECQPPAYLADPKVQSPYSWTDTHQKCFELIQLALVSAPVQGHPEPGQAYWLYTNTSDYAIAGALQQVQYIEIKDLRSTRTHKRLHKAYKKKEKVPELVTRLSKEHNDR